MAFMPMAHLCGFFEENALILPVLAVPTARHLGVAAAATTAYLAAARAAADAGDSGGANYAARRTVELAGPAATEASRVACLVFDEVPVLAPGWLRAAAAYLHLAATTLDAAAEATATVSMTNGADGTRRRLALEACLAMARRRAADAEGAFMAARDAREALLTTVVVEHQVARALLHARASAGAASSMATSIFPTATVHAAVVTVAELRVLGGAFRLFADAANAATLAQAFVVPDAVSGMSGGGAEDVNGGLSSVDSDATEPWDHDD